MKRYAVTVRQQAFQIAHRALGQHYDVLVGCTKTLQAAVEHLTSTIALRARHAIIAVKQDVSTLRTRVALTIDKSDIVDINTKLSALFQTKTIRTDNNTVKLKVKQTAILRLESLSAFAIKAIITAAAFTKADIMRLRCLRISDISTNDAGGDNYLSDISEKTLSEISYVEY